MALVLVVDDDPAVLAVLCRMVEGAGHQSLPVRDGPEAIAEAVRVRPDLAIIDVILPHLNAFQVAERCRRSQPVLPVILLTGDPSIEDSFRAGSLGFVAYLTKPFRSADLVAAMATALRGLSRPAVSDSKAHSVLANEPSDLGFGGMIGGSLAMRSMFRFVERIAPLDVTVLILGETGTGKELVARAVHARSSRRLGPFVAVNCAAFPDSLFEAEFFGHERGAFTDAHSLREGHFEQASRGTLFLDEVGEMSAAAQAKLLRVLEDKEVRRLGGHRPVHVDVRVIAATNAHLRDDMNRGRFRRDLHSRLSEVIVTLPPVRERGSDVLLLVKHFLRRLAASCGCAETSLTSEACSFLQSYSWPGNVREIEHVIRHALLQSGGAVQVQHLPGEIWAQSLGVDVGDSVLDEGVTLPEALKRVRVQVADALIARALADHNNDQSKAAKALGVHRTTIARRVAKRSL